ncbi:restriction endonuclease subunit S [Nostoc sp.]|uniref:restriction endonuclease subunit S n=1 Tax=Nostoc sp. TaxID=1180 RepID=UPI002FFA4A74
MIKKEKKRVPELRFPEFHEDWVTDRTDHFLVRYVNAVSVQLEKKYKQIGIRSHGKGIFHKDPVTGEALGNKRVYWVHPEVFTVNIVFAWEQAVALTSSDEEGYIASHRFLMFLPKENRVDLKFVLLFFLRRRGKYLLELASPGGAGRNKTLGQESFAELEITLPQKEEQEKIASFLGAVDTRLNQLRRKRELLQTYKRGVMQKFFSQEIRFKGAIGSEFPDWETKNFGDMATKISSKYNPITDDNNYPCIELESIEPNTGRLIKIFDSLEQQSIKSKFRTDDVLFGKLRPYLRKFVLTEFEGVCSTEIWVLRGKRISSKYLYYLVQSHEFYKISNVSFGSKMPRSDWDFVSSFSFEFPCKKEQQKIVDFLAAIERKIEALSRQIDQTEQFKKGLLQKLFV